MWPACARRGIGPVHHALIERAPDRVRQLIFGMDVQRQWSDPGSIRTRLICAFFPQISRAFAVLRRYDLPGNGIDQRRPLDLVHVDDDAGGKRWRHTLIGERGVHGGRILSGEREMIEPHR